MKMNSVLANAIVTLFLWLSVVAIRLISGEVDGITTFGIIVAIGTTAIIWMVWAFNVQESEKQAEPPEKAKRSASGGDDSRLSLLLELLDEDERKALKQRLVNDLGTDGEVYSLAELLGSQEQHSNQQS